MYIFKHPREKTFLGVGLFLILVGAFILAYGGVAWLYNMLAGFNANSWPCAKIIGGFVVLGLGYCVLLLELIRLKK